MIEKLQKHEIIRHGVVIEKQGCEPREIIDKINELVDAVNGMLAAQEQYATIYNEDIVPMLTPENTTMAKNATVAENGKCAKNAQDVFAEQRGWIGCVCRFWYDNPDDTVLDYLGKIQTGENGIEYYGKETYDWFPHCEPVKPDDDIIYKGE